MNSLLKSEFMKQKELAPTCPKITVIIVNLSLLHLQVPTIEAE